MYPSGAGDPDLVAYCANDAGLVQFICNNYLFPSLAKDRYRESSLQYYWHVH